MAYDCPVDTLNDLQQHFLGTGIVNLKSRGSRGQTALMVAAYCGRFNWVEALLNEKCIAEDINAQDFEGFTALMNAAVQNHVVVVDVLLRVPNIRLDLHTEDGKTAF